MEKGVISPTERGAAQGGSISPTLAVMALSGLETKLRSTNERQQRREKINVIAYADDFVVSAASETLLKEKSHSYPKRGFGCSWIRALRRENQDHPHQRWI